MPAIRYLLDTNMASYIIRGNFPRVRQRLEKVPMSEVGISVRHEKRNCALAWRENRKPRGCKL